MSRIIGEQAVVIGAGIAGLAAARALSDSFDQVVVLERDSLSGDASGRGVPTLKLLDAMGCTRPETSSIGINIDYATPIFAKPQDAPTDWLLVYPETTGARPENFEAMLKFSAALLRSAAEDPEIHKLMTEVQQLLKPPSVYNDPDLRRRIAQRMIELN